jgi:hypothetical protein
MAVINTFRIVFLLFALAASMAAFSELTSASLWMDELFTAYLTDPHLDLSDMFLRASEDVHPPAYYLIFYGISQFGGDFTVVARGFSAVLAVLALGVLYGATAQEIGPLARSFMCAFAATTTAWYNYAQEARSYALVFLIVALLIHFGLKYRREIATGALALPRLSSIVGLSIMGGLTHYYLVMLNGAVIAYFLVVAQNAKQRLVITGGGLVIVVPLAIYVHWHQSQIVADIDHTWFRANLWVLWRQVFSGLFYAAGSVAGFVLWPLILVVSWVAYRSKNRPSLMEVLRSPIGFIAFVPFGTILLLLAYTALIRPVFSHRAFAVLIPFAWVFMGIIFDHALELKKMRLFVLIVSALALLVPGSMVLQRSAQTKEAWRASAQYVNGLNSCQESVLPVIDSEQPYIRGETGVVFYGYYLEDRNPSRFLSVPRDRVWETLTDDAMAEILQARVSGASSCPILLWNVHFLNRVEMSEIAQGLRERLSLPKGKVIDVVKFWSSNLSVVGLVPWQPNTKVESAWLIVVRNENENN